MTTAYTALAQRRAVKTKTYPRKMNKVFLFVGTQVLDVNDHSPEFLFPTAFDNTVHVSNLLPVGHVVTVLRVVDRDIEKNGHVTYDVTAEPGSAAERSRFKVDRERGHVIVAHGLSDIDFRLFRLDVTATDHGQTPR